MSLTPSTAMSRRLLLQSRSPSTSTIPKFLLPHRAFHTSPPSHAASKRIRTDKRITLIRYHLAHPLTPRPLRLSRLRSLRHWTIHRAWQLHRRRERTLRERELERQYNSMVLACEELRLLGDGASKETAVAKVGDEARRGNDTTRQGGRLYRRAMDKKGIFGHGGWPIEAGRGLVEWPGREVWQKSWTR